jgi:ribosome biogenesis GTPase A
MVCGIPNVGKSTLINRLASGKKAGVGARPGITRGEQWVRLVKGIEMLDTPGVLWPKIETKRAELKLGLVGTMAEDVLGEELIIEYLWEWGKEHPDNLDLSTYGIEQWPDSPDELLERVGVRRGLLSAGNQINTLGAANAILKDFRKGKLGPCTLDDLPEEHEQG